MSDEIRITQANVNRASEAIQHGGQAIKDIMEMTRQDMAKVLVGTEHSGAGADALRATFHKYETYAQDIAKTLSSMAANVQESGALIAKQDQQTVDAVSAVTQRSTLSFD